MRLLSKAFSFRGRDTRADFLIYIGVSVLAVVAIIFGIVGIHDALDTWSRAEGRGLDLLAVLLGLFIVVIASIRVSSTCRRLRDADRSLWLALMLFVPALGGLLTIS